MTYQRHAQLLAVLAWLSCGPSPLAPVQDTEGDEDPVSSLTSAVSTCYCPAPYTCGHSSSPTYMYPAAHAAMLRAGVTDAALIQTFGDAAASVGTHCPEPGVKYSAATDIQEGSNPCARVHSLRLQGFAAWYRVPPAFGTHIHAVFSGTPSLKQSLKNQLASFAQGRNGLTSNAVETVCPITAAEKAAVAAVHNGICVPGGLYCGGDKVPGSASTLFKCNADGLTTTVVRVCSGGCSVNSGQNDSCKPDSAAGGGGGTSASGGGAHAGGGAGGGAHSGGGTGGSGGGSNSSSGGGSDSSSGGGSDSSSGGGSDSGSGGGSDSGSGGGSDSSSGGGSDSSSGGGSDIVQGGGSPDDPPATPSVAGCTSAPGLLPLVSLIGLRSLMRRRRR